MYQKASSLEQVKSYMEEKGLSLSGDIGNIMQKSLGISRDEFVQTQHAADANGDAGAHQKMQGWVNRFVDEGHVGALIGLQGAPTKDVQGDFESYKSDVTSRGGAGMEAINQSSGDAVTGARSQAGLSDTGARTPAGFGDIRKDVDAEMVDRDMEIQGSKATLDQYRDGVGGNISQMAHKSASGAAADKVIEEGAEITAGVGKVVGNAVATPVGVGVGIVNYATDKIQGKDADLGSSINAGVESARAPLNQAMDQAKGMVQGASEHHNLKQGLEAASTPSLEESWDKKKVAGSPASEPSNNASAGAPPTQDKPSGNPVEGGGRISSGFSGDRQHPVTGAHRPHTGIDIAAPHGTDVNATADGVVVFAGTKGGYGKTVDVDHGGGVVTRYAHLSDIDVKKNDKVQEGDQLGDVGSTGTSTGNHLHYEVRQNGTPVDPRPYLGNESPSEKGKGQQELQHSSDAIKEVIQGQGLTREYRQADGDIEVREGGHRNWRSNNPGNLEYGNFARNHGAIGSDGRFAIFPTMDAGTEAQKDLLKGKYGDHALQDMIPIYAPPHENDTTSYLNNIIPKGATPETKVNELNDSQFNELINKMQKHEGMKAGKTTIKDQ
jgi:murein DD-endopeptidase MepM/ murein hydrolase activator NlpD